MVNEGVCNKRVHNEGVDHARILNYPRHYLGLQSIILETTSQLMAEKNARQEYTRWAAWNEMAGEVEVDYLDTFD